MKKKIKKFVLGKGAAFSEANFSSPCLPSLATSLSWLSSLISNKIVC